MYVLVESEWEQVWLWTVKPIHTYTAERQAIEIAQHLMSLLTMKLKYIIHLTDNWLADNNPCHFALQNADIITVVEVLKWI